MPGGGNGLERKLKSTEGAGAPVPRTRLARLALPLLSVVGLLLPALAIPAAADYPVCGREEVVFPPGVGTQFNGYHLHLVDPFSPSVWHIGWWRETNGLPGLQTRGCRVSYTAYPPDWKVLYPEVPPPTVKPPPGYVPDYRPDDENCALAPRQEVAGPVNDAIYPGTYFYVPNSPEPDQQSRIGWWIESNNRVGLQTRPCYAWGGALMYQADTQSTFIFGGLFPVQPPPWPAYDADRDGHNDTHEARSWSDPTSAASTPDADDDGDGIANRNETSRAHAAGAVRSPAVRVAATDTVTAHFGAPGATLRLTSPGGARMSVTYLPTAGGACPGAPPRPVPDVAADCQAANAPAVATFDLAGTFLGARRADDPSVAIPTSRFLVACADPRDGGAIADCLVGTAADGSWLLEPAHQAPRASAQPRTPAGMQVTIGGKTFHDVAPDSGDLTAGGNGQNSRDALMPLRLWNWHKQADGATYAACSGGLASPCLIDAPPQESLLYATAPA